MKSAGKQPRRGPQRHKVFVGTAGWAIPSPYKEALPAPGSHLERYAQRLHAVEINSSFYRHHQKQTYVRWAASVPPGFRFSLKVPRALTHEGELTPDPEILDLFLDEARGLGHKLGALLVQLPPKLAFEAPVARRFFGALHQRTDVQVVCEPRHPSWGTQRVDGLLAKWGVARVAADPAPWPGAGQPGGANGFVYFRLHGQPRTYYSNYDEKRLESLHQQISNVPKRVAQSWIVFDNTALGHALGNALALASTVAARRLK